EEDNSICDDGITDEEKSIIPSPIYYQPIYDREFLTKDCVDNK
ncbi:10769_t:CDS:2, partial [Paraglomus brasilianum]